MITYITENEIDDLKAKYLRQLTADVNDPEMLLEMELEEYGIENFTVNPDGSIDVNGDVNMYNKGLTKIPFKFGKVGGYFYCSYNPALTSLKGAPKSVGTDFYCSNNPALTSLEGAPKSVGGYFYCSYNPALTSLDGAPESVTGSFYSRHNKFTEEEIRAVCNVKGKVYV